VTVTLSDPLVEKAERLLTTGRVTVQHPTVAFVKGDTGEWIVARTPGGNWLCSCPAFGMGTVCSHLVAVSLVTGGWTPEA
jgi:uncharacterized Zn finger protein